ncbi:hypothetical protein H4R35_004748 [Dimargaris xerosporica]|nr:hypothetical protein H4R35_004748 [Dimargaris xerosporica]
MTSLSALIEGSIDFQGQVLAEQITQGGIVLSAILAFIAGYVLQSFEILLLSFGGGIVLTLFLVLPPWPVYNRHPVQWLKPLTESSTPASSGKDTQAATS